jgi:putative NADPH-quinone reductase
LTGVPKKVQTIAMPQSYSSCWKKPYLAALKETDKEKLTGLLYVTELAMFLRAQELAQCADGHKELIEIAIASENLLAFETVILNWPPRLAMWYPAPATS